MTAHGSFVEFRFLKPKIQHKPWLFLIFFLTLHAILNTYVIELYRHTHFSRNPKIAQYLKTYKYVKEFGEGMDRIYRELNVNHTSEPKLHLDAFILKITVNKSTGNLIENTPDVIENNEKLTEKVSENADRVSENNATVLEKVLEKAEKVGDHLSENRISILRIMISNPYVTRPEIAKVLGISLKSVGANITAMRGKYLNRVGPDKGGFWEVILE